MDESGRRLNWNLTNEERRSVFLKKIICVLWSNCQSSIVHKSAIPFFVRILNRQKLRINNGILIMTVSLATSATTVSPLWGSTKVELFLKTCRSCRKDGELCHAFRDNYDNRSPYLRVCHNRWGDCVTANYCEVTGERILSQQITWLDVRNIFTLISMGWTVRGQKDETLRRQESKNNSKMETLSCR